MYDNRIISDSEYVVASVTRTTADNRITKRPYNKKTVSNSKKKNDSFDDNLHSATPHNSSNDNSTTFSNELENRLRIQSEENARLAQAKFNQNTLNNPNPNSNSNSNSNKSIDEIELHNKLSQAMQVEVDISTLSKKIELLNALRNESDN